MTTLRFTGLQCDTLSGFILRDYQSKSVTVGNSCLYVATVAAIFCDTIFLLTHVSLLCLLCKVLNLYNLPRGVDSQLRPCK